MTPAEQWAVAFGVAVVIGLAGWSFAFGGVGKSDRLSDEIRDLQIALREERSVRTRLELENTRMRESIRIALEALYEPDDDDES